MYTNDLRLYTSKNTLIYNHLTLFVYSFMYSTPVPRRIWRKLFNILRSVIFQWRFCVVNFISVSLFNVGKKGYTRTHVGRKFWIRSGPVSREKKKSLEVIKLCNMHTASYFLNSCKVLFIFDILPRRESVPAINTEREM